jgi:hypothetical protein
MVRTKGCKVTRDHSIQHIDFSVCYHRPAASLCERGPVSKQLHLAAAAAYQRIDSHWLHVMFEDPGRFYMIVAKETQLPGQLVQPPETSDKSARVLVALSSEASHEYLRVSLLWSR